MGGQIRPPTKLRNVNPEYPELARRAGIRGEVVLECLIDAVGAHHRRARALGPSPARPRRGEARSRSGSTRPTELNGVAVPVLLTVTVHFNLGR